MVFFFKVIFFYPRFLAKGQSFASLHHYFLKDSSKVSQETCLAQWENLCHFVMPQPTEDMWNDFAAEFQEKAEFVNCIGVIERKHVRVKMSLNSGISVTRHCLIRIGGMPTSVPYLLVWEPTGVKEIPESSESLRWGIGYMKDISGFSQGCLFHVQWSQVFHLSS